jgi:O-antigen/teichoic acid export membrane protein
MLEKLRNMIKISTNQKNIVKISSGTLLGQGISIIVLPIITRIYGAEIIGLWALLLSITVIINSFSDLGLTNSIMSDDAENIEKNYQVITTVSAAISITTSAIVTLYYGFFAGAVEMNLIFFFLFMTIFVFTLQQIQLCYTWLNRNQNYNTLMKNPLINSGVYGALAIGLGWLGFKVYGYFIAYMAGQIVTLWNMRRYLPGAMFTLKLQDFKDVIKKNKRFVIYQIPTNVVGSIKSQLPTLLIKVFWGNEMIGYYSISIKMLQIPGALLAVAIGRVFFQITSAMKRDGQAIGQFVYRNVIRAMKMAIIPMALLMAFGDLAAKIFLGAEWAIAGYFVIILAVQYFFIFLMNTTGGLPITLDKQNYLMISRIAQAFAYTIGLAIGKLVFNNIYIALSLMAGLYIIVEMVYFCMLFKVMRISRKGYLKNVGYNISLMLGLSIVLRSVLLLPAFK